MADTIVEEHREPDKSYADALVENLPIDKLDDPTGPGGLLSRPNGNTEDAGHANSSTLASGDSSPQMSSSQPPAPSTGLTTPSRTTKPPPASLSSGDSARYNAKPYPAIGGGDGSVDGVNSDASSSSPDSASDERRPRLSHGVSVASTTSELDGGALNDDEFGEGLISLREDADGSRSFFKERPRPLTPAKAFDGGEGPGPDGAAKSGDLVSGRRAGAGWELSGIRFAPLNLPLKRRLQTLVVLFHTLSIVLFLTLFFLLCAVPLAWPLVIPYTVHLLVSRAHTSGQLSRRSPFLRSLKVWSLFGSYFPARLHRTEPLPPTRKYVLGYHPHGIIGHGAFAAFATEALGFGQLFPGLTNTLLTLDSNFRVPLYRDYALAMGLASVSRASCLNLLTRGGADGAGMGRAITIVVGGAAESLRARPGTLELVLRKRLGFIKMAVRAGADLVPVLAFGENELYDQLAAHETPRLVRGAQLLLKKALGWTVPLFHARGVFNYDVGLMPYRRPVNVVVGRRIAVEQCERPEAAELERLHALYEAELRRIWVEWRGVFAPNMKRNLEIVE